MHEARWPRSPRTRWIPAGSWQGRWRRLWRSSDTFREPAETRKARASRQAPAMNTEPQRKSPSTATPY